MKLYVWNVQDEHERVKMMDPNCCNAPEGFNSTGLSTLVAETIGAAISTRNRTQATDAIDITDITVKFAKYRLRQFGSTKSATKAAVM